MIWFLGRTRTPAGLHKQWPWLYEHYNHWWWVLDVQVWPRTGDFSLPWKPDESTKPYLTQILLAINWHYWQMGEKFTHCVRRFKFASWNCASWRFSQKEKSDSFLTEQYLCLYCFFECLPSSITLVFREHFIRCFVWIYNILQPSCGLFLTLYWLVESADVNSVELEISLVFLLYHVMKISIQLIQEIAQFTF